MAYRFNHFSKARMVSAKQVAFSLWYEGDGGYGSIEQFDAFYRKIRYAFNKLEKGGFVEKTSGTRGYLLSKNYLVTHLV
jgi:hypothetical protein